MRTRLSVIFYSLHGHTYKLTEAIVAGANSIQDVEVDVFRVPELAPNIIVETSGAIQAQAAFTHIPLVQMENLQEADGYIFGIPTRFGNICTQMRLFLDKLQHQSTFVNKVGSAYTSFSAFPEMGPALHASLLQLGMIIVGMPQAAIPQVSPQQAGIAQLTGDSKRTPSPAELQAAYRQGQRVAETAKALKQGRDLL